MGKKAQAFALVVGIVLGCLGLPFESAADETGGAAWVFKVQGSVQCRMKSGQPLQGIKDGIWLQEGAFVKAGQDASASLLMKDSSMVVLHSNETYMVKRPGGEPKTETAGFWASLGKLFTGPEGDTSRTASVRSLDDETIRLLPKSGCLLSTTPHLRWRDLRPNATAVESYSVSISDTAGKILWREEKLTQCLAKLPADKPLLGPGMSYVWKVSVLGSNPPCEAQGTFRVLSEAESDNEHKLAREQAARINDQIKDPAAQCVMLAMHYLNRALTLEAMHQLEAACEADPQSVTCRQMRDALCPPLPTAPSK